MTHAFERIHEEILERADLCLSDISELKDLEAKYLSGCVSLERTRIDQNSSQLSARANDPIPLPFRRKTGLTINELRVCFNNLASALSALRSESNSGADFPIYSDRLSYKHMNFEFGKYFRDVDRDRLERFCLTPENHEALVRIGKSDNFRKHSMLVGGQAGTDKVKLANFLHFESVERLFFADCKINEIRVRLMFVYPRCQLPTGKTVILAFGVPQGLNVEFSSSIYFDQPQEVAGTRVLHVLRSRLNQVQKAMMVARAAAERKFLASLS
jgi:hypothetical protein